MTTHAFAGTTGTRPARQIVDSRVLEGVRVLGAPADLLLRAVIRVSHLIGSATTDWTATLERAEADALRTAMEAVELFIDVDPRTDEVRELDRLLLVIRHLMDVLRGIDHLVPLFLDPTGRPTRRRRPRRTPRAARWHDAGPFGRWQDA